MTALQWKKMILMYNNAEWLGRYKDWYMFEAPTSTAKHIKDEVERKHPRNKVEMVTVKRKTESGIAVGVYRIRVIPTTKASKEVVARQLLKLAKELLANKVKRTAYLKKRNPELLWEMDADKDTDVEHGYKLLESIAYKELRKLKDKGLLDHYDSGFNVSIISGINGVEGFEASVALLKFDDGLEKELKRLKFKVK